MAAFVQPEASETSDEFMQRVEVRRYCYCAHRKTNYFYNKNFSFEGAENIT